MAVVNSSNAVISDLDFTLFSKNMRFRSSTERFWWYRSTSIFYNLLQYAHYDTQTIETYLDFYRVHLIPYLGPAPTSSISAFPSFMTDDHSPLEFSVIRDASGRTLVRFSIEPVSIALDTDARASRHQFVQTLAGLEMFKKKADFEWFEVCERELTMGEAWEASDRSRGLDTGASQFFLGFECTPVSVNATMKAYFMPHNQALASGVSRETLVTRVVGLLGLEEPWSSVLDFFATSAASFDVRPSVEMLAIDLVASAQNRVKVYVRIPRFEYVLIEQYLTLGGTLGGPAVDETLRTLRLFWSLAFGIDPAKDNSDGRCKSDEAAPRSNNPSHFTSGTLLYYELKPGDSRPYPKLYIPVRHFARDDGVVALALEKLKERMGCAEPGYVGRIGRCFPHRPLSLRCGIYTYVTCAIKANKSELTTYFSPEVFAGEWQGYGGVLAHDNRVDSDEGQGDCDLPLQTQRQKSEGLFPGLLAKLSEVQLKNIFRSWKKGSSNPHY